LLATSRVLFSNLVPAASADDRGVPLTGSDAVAALLVLDDGSYLLQQRDDKPDIWYPDHWGCFGGSVDPGEDPIDALRRELYEELELEFDEAEYFTRFDFDLTRLGASRYYRMFYVVRVSAIQRAALVLHEGKAFGAFPGETVCRDLKVTPYDAFALFLHYSRGRFKA
jgi:8-oxo-dGTP pyrophosphatase MutT (NUDIX family)